MFVAALIVMFFAVCQCVSVSVCLSLCCSVLQRALPRKDAEAMPGSSLNECITTLRRCAVCMGNKEYFPATRCCNTLQHTKMLQQASALLR